MTTAAQRATIQHGRIQRAKARKTAAVRALSAAEDELIAAERELIKAQRGGSR